MTDNEIIKALECCIANNKCWECHYKPKQHTKGTLGCSLEIIKKALDLINRQQAEIERLQGENERVKNDWASQKYLIERMKQGDSAYVNHVMSEAIKEFAARLKEKTTYITSHLGNVSVLAQHKLIDNLVKEMTEVSK